MLHLARPASALRICCHRRVALLVGGDAAALLLFVAVGRGSHAELDGLAGVLDTAWPFLLGASRCVKCNSVDRF